jgi:copper resistance protein B
VPALGIGAGPDHAELRLRLSYEVTRQFAPYVGVEHERKFGQSARYARAVGEKSGQTSAVAGVRLWF